MKINKFTEKFDYESTYKEYDEYAHIDMNQLKEWTETLSNINKYLDDVKHDIHQYYNFLREYVIFYGTAYSIPTYITKNINSNDQIELLFVDNYKGNYININKVKDIKHITEVAKTKPELIIKLYNFYIKDHEALLNDIFELPGVKEVLNMSLNSEKYNI